MPKVELTERFVNDAAQVWSDKVLDHIYSVITMLERFPQLGSTDIPQSISQEFGVNVRKYVVSPFDLIYEYDEHADVVYLYGLVPCKQLF